MERDFEGVVFGWRGPSPFHFVAVPEAVCADLAPIAPLVSYGWGMVPASVTVGATSFTTALYPKDGGYVVPVRDAVRRAEGISDGDLVVLRLEVQV